MRRLQRAVLGGLAAGILLATAPAAFADNIQCTSDQCLAVQCWEFWCFFGTWDHAIGPSAQ